MGNATLGRTIAGFVYLNPEDPEWHGSICKVIDRSKHTFMGEPTFVIQLSNGEKRDAIGAQLQPWYRVTDNDDDWLYFRR